METVIETSGLTKYYGSTLGIADLGIAINSGEVFGFLGPNGAGKSTTIRLLLDFIRPTRGTATVLGRDVRAESVEIRRRVGYLPGELAMYDKMTAREMMRYFAALRDLEGIGVAQSIADRLELDLDIKIRSYSSGNRQKVGIVQALMHSPELLILDEPTNALDPLIQQEFYRIIDEVRSEGRTVFLSSHNLPEVERIADRVGIIRDGKLVVIERLDALRARLVRRIEIDFAEPVAVSVFAGLPSVIDATRVNAGNAVSLEVEGPLDEVIKAAARFEIINVTSHQGDLEDAFLAYYRRADDVG